MGNATQKKADALPRKYSHIYRLLRYSVELLRTLEANEKTF